MAQVLKVVTLLTVAVVFVYSTDYLQRRAILKGEYYVLGLVRHPGRHGADLGGQLDHAVPGPRADVAVPVRHGGVRPGFGHCGGVGHQVFRAGLDGVRNAAVRHVDRLRRDRQSGTRRRSPPRCTAGFGGNIGLVFGIAFLIVGVGFKFGAVPFHMWIPDVYEGSPTCVTVFIGTASKLAAFALAMRLLPEALAGLAAGLEPDAGGAGGAVDGDRQHRRDRADQSQAHAGVFDDFARRITCCSEFCRARRRATRRRCST